MKTKFSNLLPMILAGVLHVSPMVRSIVPVAQSIAPSSWAIVLKLAVGAAALMGFDSISSASTIVISPANATVGQPYVGTITYSGSHAGSVSSMRFTNNCLGQIPTDFVDGLTITYTGGNKASVSGTPTSAGSFAFALRVFSASNCGNGDNDTRGTALVVGTAAGGGIPPSFSAAPESVTAQVGSDVLMSAGASGNPVPQYYWKLGLTPIPDATNSYLALPNIQLTNSGLYTVTASNASGQVNATAFLSVCITPGDDFLALNYTNYRPASVALTMKSYLTNAPAGSNVYKWQVNYVDIAPYSMGGSNLNLTAAQVLPNKSAIYTVFFNSVVGANTVVNQQFYYSYWEFGYPPAISAEPQPTNAAPGGNVQFTAQVRGTLNVLYDYVGLSYVTNTTTPCVFWYQNQTNLVGMQTNILNPTTATAYSNTSSTVSLVLPNVASTDAGDYTVVVTNYWGSITSSPATLTISGSSLPPSITSQPVPRSVLVGQNTKFSVIADGTPTLGYQWQKDSADLSDGGIYSGVHTTELTLTGVQTGDQGNYSVFVNNTAGSTNSSGAMLTVSAPPSVSMSRGSGSLVQLSANTVTGLSYVVVTATNLLTPVIWLPVATNTVPASGLLEYSTDAIESQQFFRVLFP